MASALHTKINSYPIEFGIEYASNPFVLPPVRTGSNSLTNNAWAASTVRPIYVNDAPVGGSGSIEIVYSTVSSADVRFVSSGNNYLNEGAGLNDGDYSIGYWFKYVSLPTGTTTTTANGVMNLNAGLTVRVSGSSATGGNASKLYILPYQRVGGNIIINETLVAGRWYYLAMHKTTNTFSVYLDGTLRHSSAYTVAPQINPFGSGGFGSNSAQTVNAVLRVCNYYTATSSVIGPTEIAEIWQVGSTPPSTRTVKYYDGTTWQTSSAQKVFNGTTWVDWNAKRFNGSSWVSI